MAPYRESHNRQQGLKSVENSKEFIMSEINMRVGFNIRRMREEQGLSQEKLAGLADVHRAYIGKIERGEKNIGLVNLEKIAKALGVEVRDLV